MTKETPEPSPGIGVSRGTSEERALRAPPSWPRWLYRAVSLALVAGALAVTFAVLEPTPPRTVVISTGPPGSSYALLGARYRDRLAAEGIELVLRESGGAADNLGRLNDPESGVDVGFVSMGLATPEDSPEVRSLGAMFYEPVWVFYTTPALEEMPPSELEGLGIAVGAPGGLAHVVAGRLLSLLEVSDRRNRFVEIEAEEAVERLRAGDLDIAFFAAAAGTPLVDELLASPEVKLAHFSQADAYTARFPALTKLTVPAGVGSLALRLPPRDTDILAFTGSLMVKESLHPAIQSLLLEAATEIQGTPDIFHSLGRFPRPETLRIPLSDGAERFYRSGRPFLQRYLPFWMAVLVMQIVAVVIPLLAVAYPVLRVLP